MKSVHFYSRNVLKKYILKWRNLSTVCKFVSVVPPCRNCVNLSIVKASNEKYLGLYCEILYGTEHHFTKSLHYEGIALTGWTKREQFLILQRCYEMFTVIKKASSWKYVSGWAETSWNTLGKTRLQSLPSSAAFILMMHTCPPPPNEPHWELITLNDGRLETIAGVFFCMVWYSFCTVG